MRLHFYKFSLPSFYSLTPQGFRLDTNLDRVIAQVCKDIHRETQQSPQFFLLHKVVHLCR